MERDVHRAVFPGGGNFKSPPIGADRIALVLRVVGEVGGRLAHDARRIGGEGVFNIGVERDPVALELPVGWHRDVLPRRHVEVRFEKLQRAGIGCADVVEFPVAVEQLAVRAIQSRLGQCAFAFRKRHGRGMRGLFVDAENRLVFPIGGLGMQRGGSEQREGGNEGGFHGQRAESGHQRAGSRRV